MYSETIAGVPVSSAFCTALALPEHAPKIVRAFGASTKFLRDMQRHVDTVCFFLKPHSVFDAAHFCSSEWSHSLFSLMLKLHF